MIRKDGSTAAAWLSSALGVSCRLKCLIERNPHPVLNFLTGNCPGVLPGRKEGTTSSQHGAYIQGHTHTTMANNNEPRAGNCKLISKISPQLGLRAETRPHELGIGSNRGSACRGEYVLASCTHCPSSQQSQG